MNDTRGDEQLVTDLLSGDRSALAGIYDRYADSIHDTAAAMLNDRDEAADVMQDVFLIASERLAQLRDPSRLKPWLFAILRNQVYTRTKRRAKTRSVDFSAPGAPEMAAPIDQRAEAGSLAYTQLAELVRSAAFGLDARDQLAMEYSIRGELSGTDLADALGVSLEQSYVVIHRMRDRVERAMGALTVARMGRQECDDLAAVLAGWDGKFSVPVRKRVARHIERCEVCDETKRRFAVIPMMSAAPVLVAPAHIRDLVLDRAAQGRSSPSVAYGFGAPGGFPDVQGRRPRLVLVLIALLVAVLLGVGLAAVVAARSDEDVSSRQVTTTSTPGNDPTSTSVTSAVEVAPVTVASNRPTSTAPLDSTTTLASTTTVPEAPSTTAPSTTTAPTTVPRLPRPPVTSPAPPSAPQPPAVAPPPPGNLVLSSTQIDFGTDANAADVTLSNIGSSALDWSISGVAAPFTLSPGVGTLDPGASVIVAIAFDRPAAAEGTPTANATVVSSAAGGGSMSLRGVVDRAPRVSILQGAPSPTCPPIAVPTIVARVEDAAITSVVLSWSGPGASGSAAMAGSGDWSAPLGVDYVDGTWNYVVTATDAAGNTGTSGGSTLVQCPTPG